MSIERRRLRRNCVDLEQFPQTGEDPKAPFGRRQFSQTQSEPETSDLPASASGPVVTFNEPKIKVIPPSGRGSLLMHMHAEYASITDELETVCGLLSPPKSPGLLSPPRPEQSPPSKHSFRLRSLYYNAIGRSQEKPVRNVQSGDSDQF